FCRYSRYDCPSPSASAIPVPPESANGGHGTSGGATVRSGYLASPSTSETIWRSPRLGNSFRPSWRSLRRLRSSSPLTVTCAPEAGRLGPGAVGGGGGVPVVERDRVLRRAAADQRHLGPEDVGDDVGVQAGPRLGGGGELRGELAEANAGHEVRADALRESDG